LVIFPVLVCLAQNIWQPCTNEFQKSDPGIATPNNFVSVDSSKIKKNVPVTYMHSNVKKLERYRFQIWLCTLATNGKAFKYPFNSFKPAEANNTFDGFEKKRKKSKQLIRCILIVGSRSRSFFFFQKTKAGLRFL
jgi:hypothetical protein